MLSEGKKKDKIDALVTEWMYANPNDCERLENEIANISDSIPSLLQIKKKRKKIDFLGINSILESQDECIAILDYLLEKKYGKIHDIVEGADTIVDNNVPMDKE